VEQVALNRHVYAASAAPPFMPEPTPHCQADSPPSSGGPSFAHFAKGGVFSIQPHCRHPEQSEGSLFDPTAIPIECHPERREGSASFGVRRLAAAFAIDPERRQRLAFCQLNPVIPSVAKDPSLLPAGGPSFAHFAKGGSSLLVAVPGRPPPATQFSPSALLCYLCVNLSLSSSRRRAPTHMNGTTSS